MRQIAPKRSQEPFQLHPNFPYLTLADALMRKLRHGYSARLSSIKVAVSSAARRTRNPQGRRVTTGLAPEIAFAGRSHYDRTRINTG